MHQSSIVCSVGDRSCGYELRPPGYCDDEELASSYNLVNGQQGMLIKPFHVLQISPFHHESEPCKAVLYE